jgi:hypothetical protein
MAFGRVAKKQTWRENPRTMPDDAALIHALGGPRKVCELLGYDKRTGGVQRINNWLNRGIPYKVKLEHAALWMSAQQAAIELGRKKPSHNAVARVGERTSVRADRAMSKTA